jgi:Tfp pilus assembly protein PilF
MSRVHSAYKNKTYAYADTLTEEIQHTDWREAARLWLMQWRLQRG